MKSRGICLVIEDDGDISGLISFIRSMAGFDVHAVSSGAAALTAAVNLDLALITRDLGLPDIDGHDVARGMREISAAPISRARGSGLKHRVRGRFPSRRWRIVGHLSRR